MGADLSIYNGLLQRPKSVADYDAENQQYQQNALALAGTRQQQADQNALREATKGFGTDQTANYNALLKTGNVAAATSYQKSLMDNQKAQADINETNSKVPLHAAQVGEQQALAQSHALDSSIKNHDFHVQQLGAITSPDQVPGWIQSGVQSGVFTPEQAQAGAQRFQQSLAQPGGFDAWKQQAMQGGMSATDQLRQQQALLIANQQQAGENSRNAATNATHVQTTGMTQAGENSRAAQSRQTQMTIAGVAPGGGLDENGERTAQGIASGQLQPPTGMALLNPKNQRILGRVMEINPQYDSTSVTAKKKAANDFTTGTLGNSMRSFAVAGQHLDQLNTLVDALNNKDTQLINKVGNTIAEQTGNPAPTNFDAAKAVVSKEVIKAIVAGGGGVAEREELSHLMSKANSPAQLKGVIQQYRNLMGAQHDALLQQRDAAGLPRSTLPNYADANGSPAASAHPPEIADLLNKYGKK